MYEAIRTKEDTGVIKQQQNTKGLLDKIFNNKAAALSEIAGFIKTSERYISTKLEEVAGGYLQVIQQSKYAAFKKEKFHENLLNNERYKILPCLPPGLKTGKLFNYETIDNNTNKMKKPVSFLMNKIKDVFSEDD